MALEISKINEIWKKLPEDLQSKVLEFEESLLKGSETAKTDSSDRDAQLPVRSFFGVWNSGDPRSGDNNSIDDDLARDYAS
jgi:hypothetical protein